MKIAETKIPGFKIIDPDVYGDERGYFVELYHSGKFESLGLPGLFVQDNLSRSRRGSLRGLHYQVEQPQGKLVRVLSGAVFDVAVDLRRSSPAFGQWVGFELTAESQRCLYIPPGCAHGFVVISESADFFYKCTDLYAPEYERTLLWNDPAVAVDWPVDSLGSLTISEKDQRGLSIGDVECYD